MPEEIRWYAIWTHSRCELVVRDQLAAKGFESFLPEIGAWSRRDGKRSLSRAPMFPGYLFVHHSMDKNSFVEILKCRGLVRVLGERWDRLWPVPDSEIDAIRRVVASRLPALPYPYLREGQRIRVTRGPLADLEGVLVQPKPNKGLLVITVELLRRSVAVEVECTSVVVA